MLDLFGNAVADPVAEAREILDRAIAEYRPSHVFALFSGGHDSLCAAYLTSRHPAFSGVVHIDTRTGIQETRLFVEEVCRRYGWPLKVYSSPITYESLVLAHGFPGPAAHAIMYTRLKDRCIRAVVREHKRHRNDRIALVGGMRRQESRRRMGHVEPVHRVGAQVWVAPIVEWSSDDKNAFMALEGLPRNPVVDLLCMSGECLCGAFAKPGELDEIALWFPAAAARLLDLERRAACAGVHARWGTRPPARSKADARQAFMPLCWSCEAKADRLTAIEAA